MTVSQPGIIAVGILIAYLVVVGVVWRITGTRYDALVARRDHVVKGIILPRNDMTTLGIMATGAKQKPLAGILGLLAFATGLASVGFVVAG